MHEGTSIGRWSQVMLCVTARLSHYACRGRGPVAWPPTVSFSRGLLWTTSVSCARVSVVGPPLLQWPTLFSSPLMSTLPGAHISHIHFLSRVHWSTIQPVFRCRPVISRAPQQPTSYPITHSHQLLCHPLHRRVRATDNSGT